MNLSLFYFIFHGRCNHQKGIPTDAGNRSIGGCFFFFDWKREKRKGDAHHHPMKDGPQRPLQMAFLKTRTGPPGTTLEANGRRTPPPLSPHAEVSLGRGTWRRRLAPKPPPPPPPPKSRNRRSKKAEAGHLSRGVRLDMVNAQRTNKRRGRFATVCLSFLFTFRLPAVPPVCLKRPNEALGTHTHTHTEREREKKIDLFRCRHTTFHGLCERRENGRKKEPKKKRKRSGDAAVWRSGGG